MKNRIHRKWIYQVKEHSWAHLPRASVVHESPSEDDTEAPHLLKRKLLILLGALAAFSIFLQVLIWFASETDWDDNKESYKTDLTQISTYYHNLFTDDLKDESSSELNAGELN